MIPFPGGARVWLATGRTDMRKGMNGLALQVQEVLERDPHSGHLFVFRGRRGDLIKVLWHDTQGMCLFVKRLERGRFIWPQAKDGTVPMARLDDAASAPASSSLGASATGRRSAVRSRPRGCRASSPSRSRRRRCRPRATRHPRG